MNVTFACPKCEAADRAELSPDTASIVCQQCGQSLQVPPDAIDSGHVHRCVACPSTELFVRKDFPQRLGIAIVTIGLLASCVAWGYTRVYLTFAILFATAAVDVFLYLVVPDALMCYRCGAMYRGLADLNEHQLFDLETHERHRQQRIRLAEIQRTATSGQGTGVGSQEPV